MIKSSQLLEYSLLIGVILSWAVAWPVSKIGLQYMPPIWYALTRLGIGFIVIFLLLVVRGKIVFPKRQDWPMILVISFLQMASFLIFLNGGLLFVDAGRSTILVQSAPFFILPITVIWFQEKMTPLKLLGIILGLTGVLILFNPWSFNWHNTHTVIGNGLLLLAALCWAIAMIYIRYGKWHSSSLSLLPWQLLLAFFFVVISAIFIEPQPKIIWNTPLILTVLYNGILTTGFGYAAIIFVSQRLPVGTTSLLLLGVPVIALLLSAWWLGEPLTGSIITAMLFIVSGLGCVILGI